MPSKISQSVKNVIIRNYILGLGTNENLSQSKRARRSLGKGSVVTAIEEFVEFSKKNGLDIVEEDYGVTNELAQLREISETMHEAKLRLEEMVDGALTRKKLRELGVEMEDFDEFVTDLYNRSRKKHLSVPALINQCQRLEALEEEEKATPEQLFRRLEHLGGEVNKSKEKLKSIENSVGEAQKHLADIKSETTTTEKELKDFVQTRGELNRNGLDISDLTGVLNLLKHLKKSKKNPRTVLRRLNQIEDLGAQTTELRKEINHLQNDENDIRASISKLEDELESARRLLAEAEKLQKYGIGLEGLRKFRTSLEKASSDHGISPALALKRYNETLKQYGKALSLLSSITKLEEEERKTKTRTDDAKKKAQDLEEKVRDEKEYYDGYVDLRRRGVDNEKILTWDSILKQFARDVSVLENDLKKYGSWKGMISSLSGEEKGLENQRQTLTLEIEEKERTKSELEDSIQSTKEQIDAYSWLRERGVSGEALLRWDAILKNCGLNYETIDAELTSVKNLNKVTAKMSARVAKFNEDAESLDSKIRAFRQQKAELESQLKILKEDGVKAIEEMNEKISELGEKSVAAGVELGRLEPIKDAYEFLAKGEGPGERVIPIILVFLDRLMAWLTLERLPPMGFKQEIDDAIGTIRRNLMTT